MDIDLTKKIITVFGLNLSGKSHFVKHAIIPKYRCLVVDPNAEYDSDQADVYRPKANSYPAIARENEKFLESFVKPNKGSWDLLIFDEADDIFPNGKPLFSMMANLKGKYRHDKWGNLGLVFICRRPAQLFTDFPSLSHYIFTFGNKGLPDVSRLNAESQGLGDEARLLANYEYILVNPNRSFERMPPI